MNNSTAIETLVAAANNTLIVATSIMNAVDSLTKTYSTSNNNNNNDIYEMYMSSDNNTAYVKRVRDMFERLKSNEETNRIVKKRMVRKKIEIHNESRM